MRARRDKSAWFLVAVTLGFMALVSLVHAADGPGTDVTGWNKAPDPFEPDAASSSITASVVIDSRADIHLNLRVRCESGRLGFIVGMAKEGIDSPFEGVSQIDVRLDNYKPEQRAVSLVENASGFSFSSYESSYFADGTYFLLGIPVNGMIEILRLHLKENDVIAFLAQCTALQEATQKKADAETAALQKWQGELAGRQTSDAASNRAWLRENYGDKTGEGFCKSGQAMHVRWLGPSTSDQDRDQIVALPSDASYYLDSRAILVPSGTAVQIIGVGLPPGGGEGETGGLPPYCRVRISSNSDVVMISAQDLVPEEERFKKQTGIESRGSATQTQSPAQQERRLEAWQRGMTLRDLLDADNNWDDWSSSCRADPLLPMSNCSAKYLMIASNYSRAVDAGVAANRLREILSRIEFVCSHLRAGNVLCSRPATTASPTIVGTSADSSTQFPF